MRKYFLCSTRLLALFIILAAAISCSPLNPASSANDTVVSIKIGSLPGVAESLLGRAVVQGTGYLYVQTGISSGSAKLYGPVQAQSGETVSLTDIPAGTYDYLLLFYSGNKVSGLPVTGTDIADVTAKIDSMGALSSSASCWGYLRAIAIQSNQVNSLSKTLVPCGADVMDFSSSSGIAASVMYPLSPAPSGFVRHFYKLVNVNSSQKYFYYRAAAYSGTTMFWGRIALYAEDGTILYVNDKEETITDDGFSVSVDPLSTLTGSSSYYLYVEYSSSMGFNLDVRFAAP